MITNPTTNNVPIFYNSFANYPTHNGVLDWTRTISPIIVNEARVGVNYVFVNNGAAGNGLTNLPPDRWASRRGLEHSACDELLAAAMPPASETPTSTSSSPIR